MAERSGEFDDIHEMAKKEDASGKIFGQEIDTTNEFMLGKNARGLMPGMHPMFRNKQSAYRFAAWLLEMSDLLPDDSLGPHSFEQVREAIRRSGK
jgi:hypothetical protein